MKKLLALVLALVMTLGLATVSSSAAYSDAADVSLEEAVDVMSAVGVFQGADGKFSPKANLNREQAAKLIAYLDLGEDTAEALPAVKVFSDVPTTSWSAKYIAYCADAGYIAGDGTGKFNPTGELTGYAFGKMVLCVLGYDAGIEGFTGNNWSIAVAKLMESNDIAKGISTAASATLTREQAAQYCLNALKATMVEYENKGTSIEINGAKIATGASSAKAVEVADGTDYATVISKTADTVKETVELGEKLYDGDLVLTKSDKDALGRPGHTWTYDDDKIDTYADSAKLVYTESVSASDMATNLKNYKIKDAVTASVAAATYNTTDNSIAAKNTTATALEAAESKAIADLTGNGKTVEIYANSDKVITAVVAIAPKFTQISNVTTTAATSKHGAYTTYTFDTSKTAKVFSSVVDEDDDKDTVTLNGTFAKKDYITYYATKDGYVFDPVTTITGALTSITNKGVMTIDGNTYKLSGVTGAEAPAVSKTSKTFYVDALGYIIKADADDTTEYAYVVDAGKRLVAADNNTYKEKPFATLVFSDGTVKTVQVKESATGQTQSIVSYTVSKDIYTLTSLTGGNAARAVGANKLDDDTKSITGMKFNAKTVYYVLQYDENDDDVVEFQNTVTAYTGYTNAPVYATETNDFVFALDSDSDKDGIANYVFIDTKTDAADTGKYIYVKGTYINNEDGYVFDTIVAGENSTLTKSASDALKEDSLYQKASDTEALTATAQTIQNNGNLLYLNGSYVDGKTIADSVVVYFINMNDDSVVVSTAEDLADEYDASPDQTMDAESKLGTRGVYVEYDGNKVKTVYILFNSEDDVKAAG